MIFIRSTVTLLDYKVCENGCHILLFIPYSQLMPTLSWLQITLRLLWNLFIATTFHLVNTS